MTAVPGAAAAGARGGAGPVGLGLSGGLSLRAPDALDLLARAHRAGLGPLLVTEVAGLGAPELAAAFAARTPGVVTGTGIVPLGSRSTASLAMAARTVAQVAGAPFLLGVGVSTPQIVQGWHDVAHDPSVATTRERLVDLRERLRGRRSGSFALPGDAAEDVRVLLGALGPRMVELGLEVADGVILNHTPASEVAGAADGGAAVLAYLWVHACEDGDARARRDLTSYAIADPYARHLGRLGWGEAVAEVRALHAEGRLREAPARLPDDLLAALYTDVAGLPARVAAYHAAGATPILMPVTGADPAGEIAALVDGLAGAEPA